MAVVVSIADRDDRESRPHEFEQVVQGLIDGTMVSNLEELYRRRT
jgi:hypothetical protein